eukprot:c43320_g1_i1 orf=30-599(-)
MAFGPALKMQLLLPILGFVSMALLMVAVRPATALQGPDTLDFYMYVAVQNNNDLNNPNAKYTAVQSGQPPKVEPNSFGVIHTFDNPITTQQDLNSTHLGRVQGWYGDVGQSVLTLFLVQTFTYNDSKYSGTFSLLGVDVVTDARKFAPIAGGTGDFSYVRGFAEQSLLSTTTVNNETVSWFHYIFTFKY